MSDLFPHLNFSDVHYYVLRILIISCSSPQDANITPANNGTVRITPVFVFKFHYFFHEKIFHK